LILKIIQVSLLACHLKEVVFEKSSIIHHTFVGLDRICFSPGFPVKGPKFGVLSSFTHVVAPAFEVLSLSSSLFHFHCFSFSRHNSCFSHKIIFTEKCHGKYGINCPSIILEESDIPWYVFSLSNNSLLAKRYKTVTAYRTPDSL
jgi:hypothetical protein